MKTLKTKEVRWSSGRCKNCVLCSIKKRKNSNLKPPPKKTLASTKQIAAMFALFLLLSVFGSVNVYAHDTGTEHVDCTKLYLPLVNGSSGQQTQSNDDGSNNPDVVNPCAKDDASLAVAGLFESPSSVVSDFAEAGTFSVNQPNRDTWHIVNLNQNYQEPVVIMQPLSFNGPDPSTIRVRNVTGSSFQFRIDEWDYLDGRHATEMIHYMVVDAGVHTLPDSGGRKLHAGLVNVNHNWLTIPFDESFTGSPIVLSQIQTFNGGQSVVTRQRSVNANQFGVRLQEAEASDGIHTPETVGYIAIRPGQAYLGGQSILVGHTPNQVTHNQFQIDFGNDYQAPIFLAAMQTAAGPDPAALRYTELTSASATIFVEEEKSADVEASHAPESVGYIVLGYSVSSDVALSANTTAITEISGEVIELTIARTDTSSSEIYELEFPEPSDSKKSAAILGQDFDLFVTNNDDPQYILATNQVTFAAGESSKTIYLYAYSDEDPEVPEIARIQLVQTAGATSTTLDEVTITVRDDEPGITSTSRLFSADLRLVSGCEVDTNPNGYSVIRLSNDNSSANLFLSFDNLSGVQVSDDNGGPAHVHFKGDDSTVFRLPAGELPPQEDDPPHELVFQNFVTIGALSKEQQVLDALFTGQLYINIHAGSGICDTDGQISGHYSQLFNASIDFHPNDLPDAPAIEPLADQAEIKRDVVRFLTQSTFGPTEAEVQYLQGEIADDGSDRMQIYSQWIDGQLDLPYPSMSEFSDAMNQAWYDKVRPEDFGVQRMYSAGNPKPHHPDSHGGYPTEPTSPDRQIYWIGVPEVCQDEYDGELVCEDKLPSSSTVTGISRPHLYYWTPRIIDGQRYETAAEAWHACTDAKGEPPTPVDPLYCIDYGVQRVNWPNGNNTEPFWIGVPEVCRLPDDPKYQLPDPSTDPPFRCYVSLPDDWEQGDPVYLDPVEPITETLYSTSAQTINTVEYDNADAAWSACVYANVAAGGNADECPNPVDYGVQQRWYPIHDDPVNYKTFWIDCPSACAGEEPVQIQLLSMTDFYRESPRAVGDAFIIPQDGEPDDGCDSVGKYGGGLFTDNDGTLYFRNAAQAHCYFAALQQAAGSAYWNRATANDAAWFTSSVYSKAQLRERVAFALSEIFVVSSTSDALDDKQAAVASFYDVLKDGVYKENDDEVNVSTFENLLYNVSLHPAMGHYLSMLDNRKEITDGQGNVLSYPDENYAREIMQLFSIGLVKLHPDGSIDLNENYLPDRTYNQVDIGDLARIFTGWKYQPAPIRNFRTNNPTGFVELGPNQLPGNLPNFESLGQSGSINPWPYPLQLTTSMHGYTPYHDSNSDTILASDPLVSRIIGNPGSVSPETKMADVVDVLANHPNTGPFIARRLIQRLVTSNPSRRYIYDVAEAYRSGYQYEDENDIKYGREYGPGELAGVIKAILLHPEARNLSYTEHDDYGKVKEYLIQYTSLLRLLRATTGFQSNANNTSCPVVDFIAQLDPNPLNLTASYEEDCYSLSRLIDKYGLPSEQADMYDDDASIIFALWSQTTQYFEQSPLRAPSVFNWFEPSYTPVGEMAARGLTAPELQHVSENNLIAFYNEVYTLLKHGSYGSVPAFYTSYRFEGNQSFQAKIKGSVPSWDFAEFDRYLCADQLWADHLALNQPSNSAYQKLLEYYNSNPVELVGEQEYVSIKMRDTFYLVSTAPQCRIQK